MITKVSEVALEFLKSEKILSKAEGILVGGSWARGQADHNSDIDLLVVYKDRFAGEFEGVHSKEINYKNYSFSLIFQSRKNILSYLKDPDPSIISLLREGVIIYDPEKYLSRWTNKAKLLNIFKNNKWKNESKRRLKERINCNVKKIELAIKKNDLIFATYLLRGILDELIEKLRMYDEDWLYSQRKSNMKYLSRADSKNREIKQLFYLANDSLSKKEITRITQILNNVRVA